MWTLKCRISANLAAQSVQKVLNNPPRVVFLDPLFSKKKKNLTDQVVPLPKGGHIVGLFDNQSCSLH